MPKLERIWPETRGASLADVLWAEEYGLLFPKSGSKEAWVPLKNADLRKARVKAGLPATPPRQRSKRYDRRKR